MNSLLVEIKGEQLLLLPEKAIYWEKQGALILTDLHLGKAGHFRKHGIPVSGRIHQQDLHRLDALIQTYVPKQVLLLGDLFHSFENKEWNDFLNFLEVHDTVSFILVEGNHDILKSYPTQLQRMALLEIPPFSFSHEKVSSPLYNLSGHVHPGVRIRGKARQQLVLPCFYFSDKYGILPAFGGFTGTASLQVKAVDRVYGVAQRRVIELT